MTLLLNSTFYVEHRKVKGGQWRVKSLGGNILWDILCKLNNSFIWGHQMVPSCLFFYPRYNLDARGEHDDDALWEALEIAQLKGVVSDLDLKLGKKIRSYKSNDNQPGILSTFCVCFFCIKF